MPRLARTAFDSGQQSAAHEIAWDRRVKEAQLDPGVGQRLLKVVNNESPMANVECSGRKKDTVLPGKQDLCFGAGAWQVGTD